MAIVRVESRRAVATRPASVAVGNFDGVHRGHRALVAAAVEAAAERGGPASVLTFDPHPSRVLSPDRAPSSLMTLEQKDEALAAAGVGLVFVLPFTLELAHRSPEQFAREVLAESLGPGEVIVGAHFRFGRDRAGTLDTLVALGERMGFAVRGVEAVLHEGLPISSTRIREALARGAVEAARELLGRPYFIDGSVVEGDGRGRELGVPTANLHPVNELVPARGVYAGVAVSPGANVPRRRCVVNVGVRPTFGASHDTVVEAHLLDFEGDLYGRPLRIEFHAHLREERRFAGVEELRAQIARDVERARESAP